jgi:hypothetical protein
VSAYERTAATEEEVEEAEEEQEVDVEALEGHRDLARCTTDEATGGTSSTAADVGAARARGRGQPPPTPRLATLHPSATNETKRGGGVLGRPAAAGGEEESASDEDHVDIVEAAIASVTSATRSCDTSLRPSGTLSGASRAPPRPTVASAAADGRCSSRQLVDSWD